MSAATISAGREMDALVAERVMGWRRGPRGFWDSPTAHGGTGLLGMFGVGYSYEDGADWDIAAWAPSTHIEHAWQVVEVMESRGWGVVYRNSGVRGERRVEVTVPGDSARRDHFHAAEAETAPLAICRAALAAVEAA